MIPGDIASKVLQADAANIINNVGSGAALTGQQRELMEGFAVTPEAIRQKRALAFIQKYGAGQELSADQWAEVHVVYPEFRPGEATAAPPSTPAPPAFALSAETKSDKLSKAQVERFMALYKKDRRQIFRWRKEGAPLDIPAEMPAWWVRTHKWAVPAEILAAAKAASESKPPEDASQPSPTTTAKSAPPGQPSAPPAGQSIDLADYALRENEDVKQAETLVAVAWEALQQAYKSGKTEVDLLHRRHEKAMETLRKVRAAARIELQQRRLLIPREEVENDRAMAAELLRQMRESMSRRVLELCPDLPPAHRDQVAAAILRVRGHEDRVLCDPAYLRDVKTDDDLARLFSAA